MRRIPRVVAGACALVVLLAGCGGSPHAAAGGPIAPIPVVVTMTECGAPWSAPHGGTLSFEVVNQDRGPADVYLASAGTGAYYAEFEGVGAGGAETRSVDLGDGAYRFVCFPEDAAAVLGPTTEISGADASGATPGLVPVTSADLIPAAQGYQRWVTGRLPVLLGQVRALADATGRGDLRGARRAWLTAHETYETLGAAYGAFGDADTEIDAMPSTQVPPATDRHLAGFHKIEALLWERSSTAAAAPYAVRLVGAVRRLIAQFHTTDVDPSQVALRAHEIVENSIRFELGGATDAGSHTAIATIAANLRGARAALSFVTPLLRTRYAQLPATQHALAASLQLAQRESGTSLQRLGPRQHADLVTSLERTVELLAPVAAICDIRPTPEG